MGYFSEDVDIITAEDYDLWLKISKLGKKIGFLTDILGNFQLHSTSKAQILLEIQKQFLKYSINILIRKTLGYMHKLKQIVGQQESVL